MRKIGERGSAVLGASLIGLGSIATGDTAVAQTASGELQEVVVTGIRSSLETAVNAKKDAAQIVDGISAEDIGKFPDDNVAESLQRVTGIQVDRSDRAAGEGSFISIRGLNGDTSRTFINGRAALSSGFGERAVDFRDLPSEYVSFLGVVKSPSASDIEGGLSGHVEVVTARPFDRGGGFRAAVSAQAVYADLLDDTLPDVSAQISNTFGTWGFLLTAQYQERDTRQDAFTTNGYVCVNQTLEATCSASTTTQVYRPRNPRYQVDYVPSERSGISGAFQWRPSENLELVADVLYNKREQTLNRLGLQFNNGPVQSTIDPASAVISPSGTLLAFRLVSPNLPNEQPGPQIQSDTFVVVDNAETITGGVNVKWASGPWELAGDVGYSKVENNGVFNAAQMQIRGVSGIGVDLRTSTGVPAGPMFGAFEAAVTNPANFVATLARQARNALEQDDFQVKFDVAYSLEGSFLDTIRVGARYSDAEFLAGVLGARARSNFFALPSVQPIATAFPDVSRGVTTVGRVTGIDDFGSTLSGAQPGNWILPQTDAFGATFLPSNFSFLRNAPDYAVIGEKTTAGYLQLDFAPSDRLSGNIGVRVVRSEISSDAEAFAPDPTVPAASRDAFTGAGFIFSPVSLVNEYTDVLPSLNVRFEAIPDLLVLRFGASKTLFRAEADELSPRGTLDIVNGTITSGNTFLDPFRADKYDLSAEYYFGPASLASLALYVMDIESFISVGLTGQSINVPGFSQPFAVRGPSNGEGGTIRGLEASFQTTFDRWLPAPWDGFGFLANFTYTDDDTTNINAQLNQNVGLEGISERSYNAILFYEKGRLSTRAAYNYRSDYLRSTAGGGGLPLIADAYGSLDARIGFKVLDNVEVSFEAKNITDEASRSYFAIDERIGEYYKFGRRYYLGARATF